MQIREASEKDYIAILKRENLSEIELTNMYSCSTAWNRKFAAYYWSSTCHGEGTYGADIYEVTDASGCTHHNDYSGSKAKEALEHYMDNYLDETKLKGVDGYKIRMITVDELVNNLGWISGVGTSATTEGNNVPTWIYSGISYWTMTAKGNNAVYYIKNSKIFNEPVYSYDGYHGIRPVINLYKSSITSN